MLSKIKKKIYKPILPNFRYLYSANNNPGPQEAYNLKFPSQIHTYTYSGQCTIPIRKEWERFRKYNSLDNLHANKPASLEFFLAFKILAIIGIQNLLGASARAQFIANYFILPLAQGKI